MGGSWVGLSEGGGPSYTTLLGALERQSVCPKGAQTGREGRGRLSGNSPSLWGTWAQGPKERLEREGGSVDGRRGCAGCGANTSWKGEQCLAAGQVTQGNPLPEFGLRVHVYHVGLGRSCCEILRTVSPK